VKGSATAGGSAGWAAPLPRREGGHQMSPEGGVGRKEGGD
jgi:hypothetical protein